MSLPAAYTRACTVLIFVAALLIFAHPVPANERGSVEEITPNIYRATGVNNDSILEASIERLETKHRTELRTPSARQERERSRHKFRGLRPTAIKDLLWNTFGDQIESLNVNHASEVLDADKVIEFRDSNTALINPAGKRRRALVVSNIPLRNSEGQVTDLSLEQVGDGFSPMASLVDVEISEELKDGVSLGDIGVRLTLDGANPTAKANLLSGENSDLVVFPEALVDTDWSVTATPTGVETFAQLRSPLSPELISLDLELPNGTNLIDLPDGGVEMVDLDGQYLASVFPPFAVDAQGTEVPMNMTVDGDHLILQVPHQEADFAYPILVDPVIDSWNWQSGSDTTYPGWAASEVVSTGYEQATSCYTSYVTCGGPSYNSLYVYAKPGLPYNDGSQGRWSYTPPGADSYISSASVSSWRYLKGGATNGNPYAFYGLTNGATYTDIMTTNAGGGGSQSFAGGPSARMFRFGLASNNNMTLPAGAGNWRYARLGAVSFSLNDSSNPTVGMPNLSGLAIPASGWINQKDINNTRYLRASAADTGLGVKEVGISAIGSSGIYTDSWVSSCQGTYKSPCTNVTESSTSIPFRASALRNGKNTIFLSSIDAGGRSSAIREFNVYVDRRAPVIDLSDQLAEITEVDGSSGDGLTGPDTVELSLPAYKLDIDANDDYGDKFIYADVEDSGVAKVEVFLDPPATGDPASTRVHLLDCSTGCGDTANTSWTLKLKDVAPGAHTLRVVATDRAGNVSTRPIEFSYLPKTGISDDYAMQHVQFPEGEEIAVNVTNGNLVYETTDANPEGLNADIELARYYNSQLPEGSSTALAHGWTFNAETSVDPDNLGTASVGDEVGVVGETTSPITDVEVPASNVDPHFDPALRAMVEPSEDGGYVVSNVRTDETTIYEEDGKLDQEIDENGNAAYYSYDGGGKLNSVEIAEPSPYPPAKVEFSYSGGRVDEVTPSEGSALEYEYSSAGRLTSVERGTEGEQYAYDGNGRLVEIETKDGSVATVTYDNLNRVASITLDPFQGASETTSFSYDSDPNRTGRHTIVTEPNSRVVTYLIAANGDVVKSIVLDSNLQLILSGNLYAAKESILNAESYGLNIQGVGSNIWQAEIAIDDIATDELTCDPACTNFDRTWTVDRSDLAEGINNIRVLLTRQNGDYVDERFQVYVPRRDDLDEEVEPYEYPTYPEAVATRADHGFTDNSQLSAMINNPDYVPIMQQWDAPFSTAELAELNFRTNFRDRVGPIIESYGATNIDSYAGYETPEPDDGTIVVGFTQDGASHLAALRALVGDGAERVVLESPAPVHTSQETVELARDVVEDQQSDSIPGWVGVKAVVSDEADGFVGVLVDEVTTNVVNWIHTTYGANIEVSKFESVDQGTPLRGGYLYGGKINSEVGRYCSLGYGTRRQKGTKTEGRYRYTYYVMSAGHCYFDAPGAEAPTPPKIQGKRFGRWNSNMVDFLGSFDAGAIKLNTANVPRVPRTVRRISGGGLRLLGVNWDWTTVTSKKSLCVTGAFGDTSCGKARPRLSFWWNGRKTAVMTFGSGPFPVKDGDSGGLVWDRRHKAIVGIHGGQLSYMKNGKKHWMARFTPTSYVKDAWPILKTVTASTKIR